MEYEQIIPLTQEQIEQIIPHRRPFRFIDQILEVEYGKRAVGLMSDLTRPEYDWLKAHFPSYEVVPGAILVEAMAEVGGVAVLGMEQNRNKIAVLAELDKTKFRLEVKPDDNVRLEVIVTHLRSKFGRGQGRALLGDKVAAEAIISFSLKDKLDS